MVPKSRREDPSVRCWAESGQAPGCFQHRRGYLYTVFLYHILQSRVCGFTLAAMSPMVNTNDLIDAREVAELLQLSHPNATSTYLHRYPDMPKPIIDRGPNRARLWLRQDMEAWARTRVLEATGRPGPRPKEPVEAFRHQESNQGSTSGTADSPSTTARQ